jgi:hypothetical protein
MGEGGSVRIFLLTFSHPRPLPANLGSSQTPIYVEETVEAGPAPKRIGVELPAGHGQAQTSRIAEVAFEVPELLLQVIL